MINGIEHFPKPPEPTEPTEPSKKVYSGKTLEKFQESELYEKYSPYVNTEIAMTPEEILRTKLPSKIQRHLLLINLGFDTDPYLLHIPNKEFKKKYPAIIDELRSNLDWNNVGVNTALQKVEQIVQGSPATIIRKNDDEKTVQTKISSLGNLQDNDYLSLYLSPWPDKEHIVGGVISFSHDPEIQHGDIHDHMRLELQKSVWPRGMSPEKGNFITMERPPFKMSPQTTYPEGYQPTDKLLESARRAILMKTAEPKFLRGIEKLAELEDADEVAVEWQFYEGKFVMYHYETR